MDPAVRVRPTAQLPHSYPNRKAGKKHLITRIRITCVLWTIDSNVRHAFHYWHLNAYCENIYNKSKININVIRHRSRHARYAFIWEMRIIGIRSRGPLAKYLLQNTLLYFANCGFCEHVLSERIHFGHLPCHAQVFIGWNWTEATDQNWIHRKRLFRVFAYKENIVHDYMLFDEQLRHVIYFSEYLNSTHGMTVYIPSQIWAEIKQETYANRLLQQRWTREKKYSNMSWFSNSPIWLCVNQPTENFSLFLPNIF